jgi:hypothetical protein
MRAITWPRVQRKLQIIKFLPITQVRSFGRMPERTLIGFSDLKDRINRNFQFAKGRFYDYIFYAFRIKEALAEHKRVLSRWRSIL